MDTLFELLKMFLYVGAALLVLAWLGSGQRKAKRAAKRSGEAAGDDDELVDDMGEIGAAGGLLGGGVDDLFVGRFALRRGKIAAQEEARRKAANAQEDAD